MRWTLRQLADATGGRVDVPAAPGGSVPGGAEFPGGSPAAASPSGRAGGIPAFGPLTIDSREVTRGAVFVPVVAERDGHRFIGAAADGGAGAYLFAPGRRPSGVAPGVPAVAVGDTGAALLDIGRRARQRLLGPVLGITGSVGKTSTKDLAAATVGAGYRVAASAHSFNNELGVPLTLANADEDTQVTIVEMGARGVGHIALLCEVARPTLAIVTAVAAVHTELFGGLDAVAKAKAELVESLPADGTAILNGDDPRVSAMAERTSADVLRYGVVAGAPSPAGRPQARALDVVAQHVTLGDDLRARYRLGSPWGRAEVALCVRGAHQVGNSLAALAAALRLGVPLEGAVEALATAQASPWRMELTIAPSGATILNDAYNANPTSTAAALEALARLPVTRRIAVLGEMAELGPDGPAEHRRIAALAADLGVELLAVGTPEYGTDPLATLDAAAAALAGVGAGDAVLLKASRVVALERLADRLLEPSPT